MDKGAGLIAKKMITKIRGEDDRNKKSDRNKGDRNKSGNRNTDDGFKANGKIKEWPGTRKGAKTRNIRYIKREDIGNDCDKDGVKKLNLAKADGGIQKGDNNNTGVKEGEEQQNQATGNNNGCKEPAITNAEENPAKKVTKTLDEKLAKNLTKVNAKNHTGKLANNVLKNKTEARGGKSKDRTEVGENKDLTKVNTKTLTGKLAKDLGEMVTKNLTRSGPCSVPCSGRPLPGPLPTEHLNEKKAKKVTKTLAEKLAKDLTKVNTKTPTGQLAKDLGEMDTRNLNRSGPGSVPSSGRPLPGPLPTEHLNEKKAKEDTETYEEVTNKLSRLLNKYGEGKNRYENPHRMINSRMYPIKRAGQGEMVKKKRKEGEEAEGPDEGNEAVTDEGGDRNKDSRSKAGDENKALTGGHEVKTQHANPVSRNNDGSYSYPLVGPIPEEAPDVDDNSIVVQCTGTERSPVHPPDVMDNALYSQHQEDEKRDNVQDTSGRGARQGKVYEGGEVGRSAKKKDEGAGRKGDVYKGGGAGLSVKKEDEGAGRNDNVYKDEGAGLGDKKKDEGAGRNKGGKNEARTEGGENKALSGVLEDRIRPGLTHTTSKNEEGIGTDKPMSGGLEVKTRLAKDLAEVISKTLTKKIT